MNEIPRRSRLDLNEPSELAIYNAIVEIEKMPANEKLTEAVILLSKAKDLVSDYVDSFTEKDLTDINGKAFVYWKDGTIEEMSNRRLIYMRYLYNSNMYMVGKTKSDDWIFRNGKWEYIGIIESSSRFCQSCGGGNCIC